MKVLHFFKTYYPDSMGGIEQVIFQLAEGGQAHGIDSQVLFLSASGRSRARRCENHLTHTAKLDFHVASTGFSVSVFRDFIELAKSADLVHYHFPWPFMDVVHFASRLRKPTVVTYHSDIVKQNGRVSLTPRLELTATRWRHIERAARMGGCRPGTGSSLHGWLESSPNRALEREVNPT